MNGDNIGDDIEHTSQQAASAVKGAVKAGKAVAKVAAGASTMGVGTVVMAAWDNKDKILKAFLAVAFTLCLMASIAASIPTAVIHWAMSLTADTSNGDQKTLNEYNKMKDAMVSAMKNAITSLKNKAKSDAESKNYVSPDSPEARQMVTPELKAALHNDIAAITGDISGVGSSIDNDQSEQSMLTDITNVINANESAVSNQKFADAESRAESARSTAEEQAREDYENQVKQDYPEDPSLYIDYDHENQLAEQAGNNAAQPILDAYQQQDSADRQAAQDEIQRMTAALETDFINYPPRTVYKINNTADGKGLDTNSITLAIACYSISEGNDDKADPDEFKRLIAKSAEEYFTYNTSETTDATTRQKTVTYSIGYVPDGAQKMFGLSDTQYQAALTLSVNLQTLISRLNGNTTGGFSDVYGYGGGGATINLSGDAGSTGVSNNLIAFLESWEGFVPYPYNAEASFGEDVGRTIGYGHVIRSGENLTYLTQAQAEQLLINDLPEYTIAVKKAFAGTTLSQNQFDALVSLAYNLGGNNFNSYSLTRDINSGVTDSSILKEDFEKLDNVSGQDHGLLRRRDAEWNIFCNNIYTGS